VTVLCALLFAVIGGFISRFHGGGFKGGANKTFKNFLWALPACGVIALINPWLASFGLLNMLKATGHGRGLGLNELLRDDMEPEKVERVLLWLQPSLQDHAYKHLILASTGLMAVSGGVVAFMFINPLSAAVIALFGLLKGFAYEIGVMYNPSHKKDIYEATQVGEFFTGVFAYGGLAIGFIIA
jgi:hypothetical protein